MGSAQVQGEIWGVKAAEWAEVQEPTWRPVYLQVLQQARIDAGKSLLDVGCGAGGALIVARELGASVFGLDASSRFVQLALARLPGSRIEVGEMEDLPFDDEAFDVVTGFNSFQFADDTGRALREARRVCKQGGTVSMLVWGRRQDCDLLAVTLPAIAGLLPPQPADDGPIFSEPGVMEAALQDAGLSPTASGDLGCDFVYQDAATAWRAISSAPPIVRAIKQAGEAAARQVFGSTLERFTRADGSVAMHNQFRWAMATR